MQSIKRMTEFNQNFKGDAKTTYKNMQNWYRTHKPTDGVFVPSTVIPECSPHIKREMSKATMSFMKTGHVGNKQLQDTIKDQFSLHLFGTWRNSLGIYRIDRDILAELIKAPIPDDTPSHIFSRLPDWCVYIETTSEEEVAQGSNGLLGFWALLDKIPQVNKERVLGLHIIPHFNHPTNQAFDSDHLPIQMAVSENLTVLEAIHQIQDSNKNLVDRFGIEGIEADDALQSQKGEGVVLLKLLPLLLWLCAEEPDISNINGEPISGTALRAPKYGINKKTGAFVPPSQPIIYNLGKRLGGELRQFNEKLDKADTKKTSRKRPHIRRGHWHGVWRGTGQDKHFHLNWQPAIFVNAS